MSGAQYWTILSVSDNFLWRFLEPLFLLFIVNMAPVCSTMCSPVNTTCVHFQKESEFLNDLLLISKKSQPTCTDCHVTIIFRKLLHSSLFSPVYEIPLLQSSNKELKEGAKQQSNQKKPLLCEGQCISTYQLEQRHSPASNFLSLDLWWPSL